MKNQPNFSQDSRHLRPALSNSEWIVQLCRYPHTIEMSSASKDIQKRCQQDLVHITCTKRMAHGIHTRPTPKNWPPHAFQAKQCTTNSSIGPPRVFSACWIECMAWDDTTYDGCSHHVVSPNLRLFMSHLANSIATAPTRIQQCSSMPWQARCKMGWS